MSFFDYLRVAIILLITGIVGGAIAFLGNQLGRYIGRKKMSIFKLRPRYTSMLITVLTGMFIASATLGLAIAFSQPVRITLINPHEYEKKVENLETKIRKLQELQQTDLVFKKQDVILSAVVEANPDLNRMKEALKEIVSEANKAAIQKSKEIAREQGRDFPMPPGGKIVGYIPDNLNTVARELSRLKGKYIIFARAYQHAAFGERFPVELGSPLPNERIFKKGELIHRATIDGTRDYFTIYEELISIIKNDVGVKAMQQGLFPNPEDRSVGEFDYNKLKQLAREIKKENKKVTVEFYAKEDTYVRGPLKLEFWIKG